MKRINSNQLLDSLQADLRQIILQADQLTPIPTDRLSRQPSPGKWSVAQVLEHLNIYCRYYGTAIEQKLHLHQTTADKEFIPGWLGNYFTRAMKPRADNSIPKKMKAPKNAIPAAQPNATLMLTTYIAHQHQLLHLLQIAKNASLNRIRIPISLSKFITLKIGDTFRFLIAHEQRHFVQIEQVLKS